MTLQEKQAAQKQIILLQKKMVHIVWYKNKISFSDKKYGTYFGYKTIYSIYIFYQKLVHIYVKKKSGITLSNKKWYTFMIQKQEFLFLETRSGTHFW